MEVKTTLLSVSEIKENVAFAFPLVESFLKKEVVSLQEYRSAGIRTRKGRRQLFDSGDQLFLQRAMLQAVLASTLYVHIFNYL